MVKFIKELIFGKPAEGESIDNILSSVHTVEPDKKLEFHKWQHELRVGYATPNSFNAVIVKE